VPGDRGRTVLRERAGFACLLLLTSVVLTAEQPATNANRLRVHVRSLGSGRPVVVFEAGMGEDVSTWDKVQPEIAKLTTTLAYDRPGLGQTPPNNHPRDGRQMAMDLHELLERTHVPSPYVLVGHSLGGAVAYLFASMYPDEVAGLVLVDPEDGRLIEQLKARLPPDVWARREKALAEAMPNMPGTVRKELDAAARTGDQVDGALPLPAVPIVVLTGTLKNPDFPGNPVEQDLKLEFHRQLVARAPGSEQVLVPESRHYIQDDAPAVVIRAISSVLEKAPRAAAPK
jgi:pimeloyl-ACP methyl ester carboxylesterase